VAEGSAGGAEILEFDGEPGVGREVGPGGVEVAEDVPWVAALGEGDHEGLGHGAGSSSEEMTDSENVLASTLHKMYETGEIFSMKIFGGRGDANFTIPVKRLPFGNGYRRSNPSRPRPIELVTA
jgi:hypothetical protein